MVRYRLDKYYNGHSVMQGTKVCPSNGLKSLGTIVNVIEVEPNAYWASRKVEVLWETGKKKGKRTTQSIRSLVHFKDYAAAVKSAQDLIEKLTKEAALFSV